MIPAAAGLSPAARPGGSAALRARRRRTPGKPSVFGI